MGLYFFRGWGGGTGRRGSWGMADLGGKRKKCVDLVHFSSDD